MLLFPDEPNRYGSVRGEWHTQWVVWGGEQAEMLARLGYLNPRQPVVSDTAGALERTHRELVPLMGVATPESCLRRSHLLEGLILELYRQRTCFDMQPSGRDTVDRVVTYLDTHYRETVRPSELADRFAISYTHLRRLFRRTMGQSIKEYITCKRISLAKGLLLEGVRPIKRVAAAVGYGDEYYFMRLFRRHTGTSPGKFR